METVSDTKAPRNRSQALDSLGEARRSILVALKRNGPMGITDLSAMSEITYEAVRQHLVRLEAEGWVSKRLERGTVGPGRPASRYRLTQAGDHLFPKSYDDLAVALIDAAADRLGPEAVRGLLEEIAAKKVARLLPRVSGKPLGERLSVVTDVYQTDDPFCRVEYGDDEGPRVVEMNCPYLEVAKRRPALCSVTVSVLRRLLGRQVVRTERFQDGDGRCVFKVLDEGIATDRLFEWEAEPRKPLR